ncbi:MAG: nucleoside triphosphate pyrophosphohydrolase [Verrucomicrobiales bacterium]
MPHPIPSPDLPPVERLREIMHLLRAPGGCPWDAEQTHESLVKHLIEEAYEVAEAVEAGSRDELVDELGDLLLQPVFHAEIASERGAFDFDDVAAAICEKLIRRHPHVFGDSDADTPEAVLSQWEKIKDDERAGPAGAAAEGAESRTRQAYLIEKANEGLPALMAAQKIQKKAARVGFDWPELPPVLEKAREELEEVAGAMEKKDADAVAEEIGDLLFAVVNLARATGNEAELLLHRANRKFVKRFRAVEDSLRSQGKELGAASLEEMDAAWELAKSPADDL